MIDRPTRQVPWRLLEFKAASGRWQMAADLYLYRAISGHPEPLVVRFYRFAPPTITIGYHQAASRAVDMAACAAAGIGVARRPTGGRALLHRNEINYAVIADTARAGIFGTGLAEGFCQISTAIAAGLGRLGVHAEVCNHRSRSSNRTMTAGGGICAATTTRYEITFLGKKLVAAAQLRSAERLLQHGTIYLNETEVVPEGLFGKAARSSATHMSSLSALLGGELSQDTIIQELIHGLCLTFGRFARRDSLTHVELETIDSLVNDQENLPL